MPDQKLVIRTPAPRRRCHLTLQLGADDIHELARALTQLADDAERGQRLTVTGNGASGGVGSGFSYEYVLDESMTADRYQHDLAAWVEANRS